MKYPTLRFVFDRKKTATKQKTALVQLEILCEGKKKYLTTGVKVYSDQWSPKNLVVHRNDMQELNDRLLSIKKRIDDYISGLISAATPFTWPELERFLARTDDKKETFLQYARRRVGERTDIAPGTRRNHTKVINTLEQYGGIVTFQDLTRANILNFYEWLMARKVTKIDLDGTERQQTMAQQTVSSYMKILKLYIHDAMERELIDKDPTDGLKFKRGDSEPNRWLTEEEVHQIEATDMPTGSLQRVKDRFLVQVYTGLSFSDLMDLNISKLEDIEGRLVITGNRIKTGEPYVIAVLPEVKAILEKYNYRLPPITNEQYNIRLKTMADIAGINKRIASHWCRRTFACIMINRGLRAETLAQTMGHADMRTTMEYYARMKKTTVATEMLAAMDNKKGTPK